MTPKLDVDRTLAGGGLRDVFEVLFHAWQRWHWETELASLPEGASDAQIRMHERELAKLAEASPLEGLAAAARLRSLLEDVEYVLVDYSRQQGASWAKVGTALGVTAQSAWEKYRQLDEAAPRGRR